MKLKVDLLIIDYEIRGFERYAINICKELRKRRNNMIIAVCYMERVEAKPIEEMDYVFCAHEYFLDPKKIFNAYNPKMLLNFAHRIFDYMFTIEAHKRKIKVFNFQHGLYQTNTTVSSLSKESLWMLLKKKRNQLKIYSKCLYYIAEGDFEVLGCIIWKILKNNSIYSIMNEIFGRKSNADVSFIFGEYWKEFYKNEYLEIGTQFKVVGYPELEGKCEFSEQAEFSRKELSVICYIAQTSVEDGVLNLAEMTSFLNRLEILLENYNLIIKLHPRSDKKIYEKLLHKKNKGKVIVWNKYSFPIADGYIGHESTLIGRALYITNKVLIVRLRENRNSIFEKYSDYVCESEKNLLEVLNKMMLSKCNNNLGVDLKNFIYMNCNGAIKQTAEFMLQHIVTKKKYEYD